MSEVTISPDALSAAAAAFVAGQSPPSLLPTCPSGDAACAILAPVVAEHEATYAGMCARRQVSAEHIAAAAGCCAAILSTTDSDNAATIEEV